MSGCATCSGVFDVKRQRVFVRPNQYFAERFAREQCDAGFNAVVVGPDTDESWLVTVEYDEGDARKLTRVGYSEDYPLPKALQ